MAYNFCQDLLDTYQSLSDPVQLAWLVVPPMFVLILILLVLRYRLLSKRREPRQIEPGAWPSSLAIYPRQQIHPLDYDQSKGLLTEKNERQ